MKNTFTSTGTLVYDPHRGTMKRRTAWWCVIDVDKEITRYARYWMDRYWYEVDPIGIKRKFCSAPWDAHISVLRGEKPKKNITDWGKYNGIPVNFTYTMNVRKTDSNNNRLNMRDEFWFLDVSCEIVNDIREHFGLPISYQGRVFRPHLTVAKVHGKEHDNV